MAAGLGTRLRPLTHAIPKPLVPVANRPIMEHILARLARDGFDEVIANLHWFPDTIRDHFGDGSRAGVELRYSSSSGCWARPAGCATCASTSAPSRSW